MDKTKRLLLGLILALLINIPTIAQVSKPIKVWDLRYGGDTRDTDVNTIRTSDGGFLLTGSSLSGISGNKTTPNQGDDDWWVLKLDGSGNIVWDFNFGGTAEDGFEAGATETSDGNFVLAGRTRSGATADITSASFGRNDILVVKIDRNGGGVIWQTRAGGNSDDVAFDVVETSDGSIVVGGYTVSTNIPGNPSMGSLDAYLVKLDANGNLLWQKTYGGSGFESVDELLPDSNGGVVAGSYSASTDLSVSNKGSFDFWLFQADANGNQLWENTYGGSGLDATRALTATPDGGYLLGGQSNSGIGGDKTQDGQGLDDMWLVKTNATGDLLWEKSFGGDGYDWAQSIYSLSDGSFVFGGFSNSTASGDRTSDNINGSLDVWFLKADADGNEIWQGIFGGTSDDGVVNIPYYDENADEIYISGATTSSLGAYFSSENFGTNQDAWLTKFRINNLDEQAETCTDQAAKVLISASIENKTYQLRNAGGTDNGAPLVGTGGTIELVSGVISEVTTLSVFALSELSDGSILEEFLGNVEINLDSSLDAAKASAISFDSQVAFNKTTKVRILESVTGVNYQLVDEDGVVHGERMGNGNEILINTKKLKETVLFRLRLVSETCTDYHPEDILINVSAKIKTAIQFDRAQLTNDQEIEFSTIRDEDIVAWEWMFERGVRKSGRVVTHKFRRAGNHVVKLRVENQAGFKKEIARSIQVRDQIFISAPGIFKPHSPHGPFKVKLKNVTDVQLTIFSQYGRPIYKGKNSWKGTKRGKSAAQGLYIYYIRARKKDGTLYQKRGSFYLKH